MKFIKNKTVIIVLILVAVVASTFVIVNKTKNPSLHNTKKYSVDKTGKTDTTVAFQKMVDSYPQGSTIKLPKGKYSLHNTVKLKDGIKLVAKGNVNIVGTGKNTLFSVGNTNSFQGIDFQNCDTAINVSQKKGLKVTDCKFTNKINFAAINFSNASDCSVTNSSFYDISKYGILIDKDSSNITVDKNNFDNPKVFGGYSHEQISGHVYCLNGSKIFVTNNIIKNSGGQGIIFSYNSTTRKGTTNSVASNNLCEGNGQEGITTYGGSKKLSNYNTISNNTSKNNRFNQIEIWQSNYNVVKNNTVDESTPGTGNLGAICLFATTGSAVTGNKVLSSQTNGIAIVAGTSNCNVSSNIITNTNKKNNRYTPEKGNGILLDWNGVADPQYITMTNNKISSSKGIIAKSGIYSTSNRNHHNKISGTSTKGYKYGVHWYALETCGK